MTTAEAYEQLRPLMFSIAYRMLGQASEAEDVVQEAFLRYHRAQSGQDGAGGGAGIDSPKAYLSSVTTRLCIDYLRSARVRRRACSRGILWIRIGRTASLRCRSRPRQV